MVPQGTLSAFIIGRRRMEKARAVRHGRNGLAGCVEQGGGEAQYGVAQENQFAVEEV